MNHSKLEIVGYGDVLSDDIQPCIVPPVFQIIGTTTLILPPFQIKGNEIIGGIHISQEKLETMVDQNPNNSWTRLPCSIKPKIDHELWVDESGSVQYEEIASTRAKLKEIGLEYLETAQRHIKQRDFKQAAVFANKSNLAYLGLEPGPFVVFAVIAKMSKRGDDLRLIYRLIEGIIDKDEFDSMVQSTIQGL